MKRVKIARFIHKFWNRTPKYGY